MLKVLLSTTKKIMATKKTVATSFQTRSCWPEYLKIPWSCCLYKYQQLM